MYKIFVNNESPIQKVWITYHFWPFLEGNQLWFDLFIVPFILSGIFFLLSKRTTKNLIIAGLMFGIAALIKQTSGLLLIVSAVYLFVRGRKFKEVLYLAAMPLFLGGLLLVYLLNLNVLAEFANWNLIYPFTFWSKFPGYVQMNITNGQMLVLGTLLFPIFVIAAKSYKLIFKDKNTIFLIAILATTFVMIYPRFSFFHFQLALSVIAILFGYLVSRYRFSPVLQAFFWMFVLFVIALPVFKRDLGLEARFWDKDTVSFSNKLKQETDGKSVFLLGLPSSIYVFSDSVPPRPWLDNYGWYFEIPGVQEDTIVRWGMNKPDYIVTRDPEQGNWYDLGVYRPGQIVNWIDKGYEKKELLAKGVWLWQMK